MAIFAGQRFYGLHLRCLAWVNGAITTRTFFKDIITEAKKTGIKLTLPELPDIVVEERNIRKSDIGRLS